MAPEFQRPTSGSGLYLMPPGRRDVPDPFEPTNVAVGRSSAPKVATQFFGCEGHLHRRL